MPADIDTSTPGGSTAGLLAGTGIKGIEVVRKAVTESVVNTAAPQADDALFFALAAGERVFFRAVVFFTTAVAAGLRLGFSQAVGTPWAAGSFVGIPTVYLDNTGVASAPNTPDGGGSLDVRGLGVGVISAIVWEGHVLGGAGGAGGVRCLWAQAVANAESTFVMNHSFITVYRL